jgi:hypothetical protein
VLDPALRERRIHDEEVEVGEPARARRGEDRARLAHWSAVQRQVRGDVERGVAAAMATTF